MKLKALPKYVKVRHVPSPTTYTRVVQNKRAYKRREKHKNRE